MASKQEMLFSINAVREGLLTRDQVQECMDIQRAYKERKNQDVQLLAVFVQKGYLTREQIAGLRKAPPPLQKTVTLDQARQIDGFDVQERIGEGGVATVFRAYDPERGHDIALKVLFPAHATSELFVQRFLDEGRLLATLTHPNMVQGYEVGVWPNEEVPPAERLYYMTMELVEGASVQDELNEKEHLDESKALHIILQIAEALDYLQQHNVVHRDIKPDNILYSREDRAIKLCDLGFAKEIEDAASEEVDDTTCGTVQYISPEQARGLKDVDIRADIYSLGATLYHFVIGEVPFAGKDSYEVMAAQVLNSLESEKYRKRGLSPYIGYFLEKMMAKEREVRYQTPREAIDDITEIMEGAGDLIFEPDNEDERYGGNAGGKSGPSSSRLASTGASPRSSGGSARVSARRPVGPRSGRLSNRFRRRR